MIRMRVDPIRFRGVRSPHAVFLAISAARSLLFDQSALDALAKVTQVRPPPEGMDRTGP